MSKKGFSGRVLISKYLKAKLISKVGGKITTSCLTCFKKISLTPSRYKNDRGKFCSHNCDKNFKPDEKLLNLICKDKFGVSIKDVQKKIIEEQLTATEFGKLFDISPGHITKIFLGFKINQYYNPDQELIKRNCKRCNKEFTFKNYPSKRRENKSLFCSTVCRYTFLSENKKFDYSSLSFDHNRYKFFNIGKVGNYTGLNLGFRESSYRRNINYNDFFFKNGICDEQTAYVLGLWYSDGNISGNRNVCAISLTDHQLIRDVAKIFNFKRKFYEYHYLTPIKKIPSSQLALKMTSPFLRHDFIQLGCAPSKSYITNYPNIEDKFDRHFIRGIIDGDGSFSGGKNKNAILKIVGTEQLMFGIFLKIKKHLGLEAQSLNNIGKKYPDKYKMKNFCSISYGEKFTRLIADWIYKGSTIYLKRKKTKAYDQKLNKVKLLGTQKIADFLGVSRLSIADFIKNKKNNINYFKIGKYNIIAEEGLDDFLIKFKKYVMSSKINYYSLKQKEYLKKITVKDILTLIYN